MSSQRDSGPTDDGQKTARAGHLTDERQASLELSEQAVISLEMPRVSATYGIIHERSQPDVDLAIELLVVTIPSGNQSRDSQAFHNFVIHSVRQVVGERPTVKAAHHFGIQYEPRQNQQVVGTKVAALLERNSIDGLIPHGAPALFVGHRDGALAARQANYIYGLNNGEGSSQVVMLARPNESGYGEERARFGLMNSANTFSERERFDVALPTEDPWRDGERRSRRLSIALAKVQLDRALGDLLSV